MSDDADRLPAPLETTDVRRIIAADESAALPAGLDFGSLPILDTSATSLEQQIAAHLERSQDEMQRQLESILGGAILKLGELDDLQVTVAVAPVQVIMPEQLGAVAANGDAQVVIKFWRPWKFVTATTIAEAERITAEWLAELGIPAVGVACFRLRVNGVNALRIGGGNSPERPS